jgi:hypothetical protein
MFLGSHHFIGHLIRLALKAIALISWTAAKHSGQIITQRTLQIQRGIVV